MAQVHSFAGNGHVDGLSGKTRLQSGGLQLRFPLLQTLFQLSADAVGKLTHDGTLLGRQLAHLLQECRQLALFAKNIDAHTVQRYQVRSLTHGGQSAGFDLFQLFSHIVSPFGDITKK